MYKPGHAVEKNLVRYWCPYHQCLRIICRHRYVTGGWYRWRCPCGWSKLNAKWITYPDMGTKTRVAAKENTMRKQKRSKRSKKQ